MSSHAPFPNECVVLTALLTSWVATLCFISVICKLGE